MMRLVTTITALITSSAVALSAFIHPRPLLMWNATASAPIGLYRVEAAGHLMTGDLVVVKPPIKLADFLAVRGYLPLGIPLIKHVAALSGAKVCRRRNTISIRGIGVATALDHDGSRRPLPRWEGCAVLKRGDVFLLNVRRPDSLDGRYFGPLPVSTVIGRAIPISTRRRG